MNIIDCIKLCDDGKPSVRDIKTITTLAVHRIERWGTPIEICQRFIHDPEVAKYTGGEVPYTFFIDSEGIIWQALQIGDVGRHAKRWNVPAIGIACVGDFRSEVPPGVQLAALERLCFSLITALRIGPEQVQGHDELPGGSSDVAKRCPGKNLSMDHLRARLRVLAGLEQREARLRAEGFIV